MQSFGITVSSMSKLLQYLDQAVAHDPQTLEQNIMDKSEHQAMPSALGRGSKRTAASDAACGPGEARGSVGAVGAVVSGTVVGTVSVFSGTVVGAIPVVSGVSTGGGA